jgi:hypothetical protein
MRYAVRAIVIKAIPNRHTLAIAIEPGQRGHDIDGSVRDQRVC